MSETDDRLRCRYCKEAENTVIEFKAAVQKAEANCRLISDTMLLKVERKRMYDHREFAAQQADHHVKVRCVYLAFHANKIKPWVQSCKLPLHNLERPMHSPQATASELCCIFVHVCFAALGIPQSKLLFC